MSCLVCHQPHDLRGTTCAECLEELKLSIAITPEQVRACGGQPTTAVFVDAWGRAHSVRRTTIIGRSRDEDGLVILDGTISRRHAALKLRGDAWLLTDLGSSNGTFIEGRRLHAETQLRDGEQVRFGDVKFFFLEGVLAVPDVDTSTLGAFTVRGPVQPVARKPIQIELREPTGGGGGFAVIDGKTVSLTLPQFELLALLQARGQSGEGFVAAAELVRRLSLDSTEPSEDHIRQLVRRLRRVLFKVGIQDLIESRYGAGYRLSLFRS